MTEDTRLTSPLKKVKNIRQYVFSGRTVTAQPRLPNDLIELLGFLLSNSFRLYGVICLNLRLYGPFYWTAKTIVSPSHQPEYYMVKSRLFYVSRGIFPLPIKV